MDFCIGSKRCASDGAGVGGAGGAGAGGRTGDAATVAASGDAVDVGAGGAGGAGRDAGTAVTGGAEDEEAGAGAGCDAGAIKVSMATGWAMRSAGARRCFKGVILNCFAAGPALAAPLRL